VDSRPWLSKKRSLVLLALGTLFLKSLIFAPVSWWPITFVCLVPWLIAVGTAPRAPWVYLTSFLWGVAFFLINMRWLIPATGWGYIALCIYQALYFPLMACAIRHVIRRRTLPLALGVALIWTGNELLRAVAFSGFPWFFLSHALYKVRTLIQVSDLVGAYGTSFLVAAINGAIADFVLARFKWDEVPVTAWLPGRARRGALVAAVLLLLVAVYGQVQLRRHTITPGPKVAVIQGDFLSLIEGDEESDATKRKFYLRQIEEASQQRPDLFLLPETPWIMYLNPEMRSYKAEWRESFESLQEASVRHRAYLVTGSASLIETPKDLLATERRYNSAMVFRPDGLEPSRYDKVHVVPFGEAVPFRFGRFRFLYFWLNRMMPFSGRDGSREYSMFPGNGFHVFAITAESAGGREFRFGIPICYEDVMPYVCRAFVNGGRSGKRADFLLNISNDGWFGRGIQQPQHLAVCVFRAVENRVGIARAVNTGISGFIQPDGRIHDVIPGDPKRTKPTAVGHSVAQLGIDSRYAFYTRFGDWFGWLCVAAWAGVFLDYWMSRLRGQHELKGEPVS
jgi:apolipoprotein N-acyltransferase